MPDTVQFYRMTTQQQAANAPMTQWHRLLGTLLEYFLTPVGIEVSTNVEVMSTPPEADILLLRRHEAHWSEEQKARLPDGIRDSDASHILIEFKYTESLNEQVLRQAVGYDYFYQTSRELKRQELLTVVVSAKTPRQPTLDWLGYEGTEHSGVYRSQTALIRNVLLLVSNDLAETPHNAPIKCFASRKPVKQQALLQLSDTRWKNVSSTFWWFLDGLFTYWFQRQGGESMPQEQIITPEFITQLGKQMVNRILATIPPEEVLKQVSYQEILKHLPMEEVLKQVSHQDLLKHLSPEERLSGLKPEERLSGLKPEERLSGLKPEERLSGLKPEERLSGLKPEERLKDLDIEEIERYLQKRKQQAGKSASSETSEPQDDSGSNDD